MKKGNAICNEEKCMECPLRYLTCAYVYKGLTLFEALDSTKERLNMPNEIYLLVKKDLEKEMERL